MFSFNLMKYSARRVVAEHGYTQTLATLKAQRAHFSRLLRKHGVRLKDPGRAPARPSEHPYRSKVAKALSSSLGRLEVRLPRR
jgi:hypothetical protein